jgi:hypothetical protein
MNTSIVRFPGLTDPKDKIAEKAEKKIRKVLGNSAPAKILGKLIKIWIQSIPT